jgi:hypothetical protein
MKLHLAKSPCWPPYGIIQETDDGRELWDCDCASGSVEQTLAFAAEEYPGVPVLGFGDPDHYSNRKRPRSAARADDETAHDRCEG